MQSQGRIRWNILLGVGAEESCYVKWKSHLKVGYHLGAESEPQYFHGFAYMPKMQSRSRNCNTSHGSKIRATRISCSKLKTPAAADTFPDSRAGVSAELSAEIIDLVTGRRCKMYFISKWNSKFSMGPFYGEPLEGDFSHELLVQFATISEITPHQLMQ